jgi:hypothetical protein
LICLHRRGEEVNSKRSTMMRTRMLMKRRKTKRKMKKMRKMKR